MSKYITDDIEAGIVASLAKLVAIPSKNAPEEGNMPFGKNVNDALEFVATLASDMGFEAKNLGYCTEVKFGSGNERIDIAVHVDVVPEGDGWTYDPFTLTEKDGCLYGRGVLDDKGPAIAVLYALKALKDSGHVPNKEIRLIFGGAEETGMSDLKKYVEENGFPDFALSPDSEFPITSAEFGVIFGKVFFGKAKKGKKISLVSLNSGVAPNCVPDKCRALFACEDEDTYARLLKVTDSESSLLMNPRISRDDEKRTIEVYNEGISVHGSVPDTGINAFERFVSFAKVILAEFGEYNILIDGLCENVFGTDGSGLGIACKDDVSGALSVNVGMCRYSEDLDDCYVTLDIRVPVTFDVRDIVKKIENKCSSAGLRFELNQIDAGTYMASDNKYLASVAKSYEKVTGKKAEMLCARGVTYAKSFEGRGIAFGPIEENLGEGGGLHGADEFIKKAALFRTAEIYAETLADLTV